MLLIPIFGPTSYPGGVLSDVFYHPLQSDHDVERLDVESVGVEPVGV